MGRAPAAALSPLLLLCCPAGANPAPPILWMQFVAPPRSCEGCRPANVGGCQGPFDLRAGAEPSWELSEYRRDAVARKLQLDKRPVCERGSQDASDADPYVEYVSKLGRIAFSAQSIHRNSHGTWTITPVNLHPRGVFALAEAAALPQVAGKALIVDVTTRPPPGCFAHFLVSLPYREMERMFPAFNTFGGREEGRLLRHALREKWGPELEHDPRLWSEVEKLYLFLNANTWAAGHPAPEVGWLDLAGELLRNFFSPTARTIDLSPGHRGTRDLSPRHQGTRAPETENQSLSPGHRNHKDTELQIPVLWLLPLLCFALCCWPLLVYRIATAPYHKPPYYFGLGGNWVMENGIGGNWTTNVRFVDTPSAGKWRERMEHWRASVFRGPALAHPGGGDAEAAGRASSSSTSSDSDPDPTESTRLPGNSADTVSDHFLEQRAALGLDEQDEEDLMNRMLDQNGVSGDVIQQLDDQGARDSEAFLALDDKALRNDIDIQDKEQRRRVLAARRDFIQQIRDGADSGAARSRSAHTTPSKLRKECDAKSSARASGPALVEDRPPNRAADTGVGPRQRFQSYKFERG